MLVKAMFENCTMKKLKRLTKRLTLFNTFFTILHIQNRYQVAESLSLETIYFYI